MFYIKGKCKLINANCFDVLKRMPDSCMDVTFTSPPYNRKRNIHTSIMMIHWNSIIKC